MLDESNHPIVNQLAPAIYRLRAEEPAVGRLSTYLDQLEGWIARRRTLIEDGTILGTSVRAR